MTINYEPREYYYDLDSDFANLGVRRDTLQVGDTFEHDGKTFEILEREDFNRLFKVIEVKNV